MLPSQTQRVLMVVALAVGVWPAAWGLGAGLGAVDGSGGLTGWNLAGLADVTMVVLGVLPLVALAGALGATGNRLSGVWTLAAGLTVAGWLAGGQPGANGPMGAVMRRAVLGGEGLSGSAGLGGAVGGLYARLALEAVVWATAWAGALAWQDAAAGWLRGRLPRRLQSRHLGAGETLLLPPDGPRARPVAWIAAVLGSSVLAAAVAGVLVAVLVRSPVTGQVVGGLFVAFTVGALVSRMVLPADAAVGVLLSPVWVAVGGYALAWIGLREAGGGGGAEGGHAMLAALYAGDLPGVAMVLPLQYLSAGVLGAATGLGLGQVLERAKGQAVAAAGRG